MRVNVCIINCFQGASGDLIAKTSQSKAPWSQFIANIIDMDVPIQILINPEQMHN
jgi:hypothetical protein